MADNPVMHHIKFPEESEWREIVDQAGRENLEAEITRAKASEDAKQGKLTAGKNITITQDNVISSTGSGEDPITNYDGLTGRPSINGVTLSGDQTGTDLGLQQKLTAGANIIIDGDTISATGSGEGGTTYTAGTGILISGTTIKADTDTGLSTSGKPADAAAVGTALSKKQDTLTAVSGVIISGTTIKADTDTNLTSSVRPANAAAVGTALSGKQDKLTAGTGISISGTTIKANTDTGLTVSGKPADAKATGTAIGKKQDVLTAGNGITIADDGTISSSCMERIFEGSVELTRNTDVTIDLQKPPANYKMLAVRYYSQELYSGYFLMSPNDFSYAAISKAYTETSIPTLRTFGGAVSIGETSITFTARYGINLACTSDSGTPALGRNGGSLTVVGIYGIN